MREVPLGDICEVQSGFAFNSKNFDTETGLPLIRIRDVQRGYSEMRYDGKYDPAFLIEDGDFLIGMDGEFNIGEWCGGTALLNQRVCKISINTQIAFPRYAYYALGPILKRIEAVTPFVTVKHLSANKLRSSFIPLPPLAEQKRIAAILEKADGVRRKISMQNNSMKPLVRNTFLDLFGDPATNPKGWPIVQVSDFVKEFQGGKNIKPDAESDIPGQHRVLKISAVTCGEFQPDESKPVSVSYTPPRHHFVNEGDLLISRANGNPELVGATAHVTAPVRNLLLPDKIWRFVFPSPSRVMPEYINALFQTSRIRSQLTNASSGCGPKNISMSKVMSLYTALPPFSLQQDFAARVQVIRRLEEKQKNAFKDADDLFQSLLQRAFSGSL